MYGRDKHVELAILFVGTECRLEVGFKNRRNKAGSGRAGRDAELRAAALAIAVRTQVENAELGADIAGVLMRHLGNQALE